MSYISIELRVGIKWAKQSKRCTGKKQDECDRIFKEKGRERGMGSGHQREEIK